MDCLFPPWISLDLPSISCLEQCINLTDLDLSNNAIIKIEGLDTLLELRRLNLSSNRIRQVSTSLGLPLVSRQTSSRSFVFSTGYPKEVYPGSLGPSSPGGETP